MYEQALLILDVQSSVTGQYPEEGALLDRVTAALVGARTHGVLPIFVRVALRASRVDVSSANKAFAGLPEDAGLLRDGAASAQVHPAVGAVVGDVIVTKRRVSAFAGGDLEVVLRSQEVRTLILCGFATSGVVLSTLRQAADLDYALVVLSDACADGDEEVQRVLMEKVFPSQAHVLSVGDWIEGIYA